MTELIQLCMKSETKVGMNTANEYREIKVELTVNLKTKFYKLFSLSLRVVKFQIVLKLSSVCVSHFLGNEVRLIHVFSM